MSGKYRVGRSPEGVTEGADAMSYYNALQFTARYKLATMCPALSFSVIQPLRCSRCRAAIRKRLPPREKSVAELVTVSLSPSQLAFVYSLAAQLPIWGLFVRFVK